MQRLRTVITWTAQILLGVLFLLAGVGKLSMFEPWARRFDTWGYAPWFLVTISLLEVVGAVLVFVPRTAAYGAAVLGVIMLGAAYTHVSSGIGSLAQVIPNLVFCVLVLALRWRDRWHASAA